MWRKKVAPPSPSEANGEPVAVRPLATNPAEATTTTLPSKAVVANSNGVVVVAATNPQHSLANGHAGLPTTNGIHCNGNSSPRFHAVTSV